MTFCAHSSTAWSSRPEVRPRASRVSSRCTPRPLCTRCGASAGPTSPLGQGDSCRVMLVVDVFDRVVPRRGTDPAPTLLSRAGHVPSGGCRAHLAPRLQAGPALPLAGRLRRTVGRTPVGESRSEPAETAIVPRARPRSRQDGRANQLQVRLLAPAAHRGARASAPWSFPPL